MVQLSVPRRVCCWWESTARIVEQQFWSHYCAVIPFQRQDPSSGRI